MTAAQIHYPIDGVRDGDVFAWRYADDDQRSKVLSPYWCCCQFAVAKGGLLVDMYWSTEDGRTLSLTDSGVIYRKLGNLDEYVRADWWNGAYYADADILDLRHANGGKFYIKKNAARDRDKMLAEVERRMEEARCKIRVAESELERAKSLWMELKCHTPLDQIHL